MANQIPYNHGYLYNQAKVGLNHKRPRFLVAVFNASGQIDLIFGREQRYLTDFPKVDRCI